MHISIGSHHFQSPLQILFELDKNIASNWDLYLITILTLILGTIFYFRRPPVPDVENQERDNNREPQGNQEPAQPLLEEEQNDDDDDNNLNNNNNGNNNNNNNNNIHNNNIQ